VFMDSMKPYKMKVLCFVFPNAQGVLYFLLENVVLERVLCSNICYNTPIKIQLTLVHYGKILHTGLRS